MRLEVIVGENVRRLRLAKGLSQEAFAFKVGIDMRYLGGIERGQENPTIRVVARIAKALGVQANTLLIESRSK